MRHLFLAGLVSLSSLRFVSAESPVANIGQLSAAQRKVIVIEASKALNDFVLTKQKGRDIPERFRGGAIHALKPLRVARDWTNVKIVLAETADSETGLYIVTPASSYAPTRKRFAELTKLSEPADSSVGVLYRYREMRPPPH